jgi:hypothetical protein
VCEGGVGFYTTGLQKPLSRRKRETKDKDEDEHDKEEHCLKFVTATCFSQKPRRKNEGGVVMSGFVVGDGTLSELTYPHHLARGP